MRALIPVLTETFTPVVKGIIQHYKRKITYAPTDVRTFYEDLEQECWVGLWRALIRFDDSKMAESPPEAYISKVIRSHVKETPIGTLLHIAKIPHSKWSTLPAEVKDSLKYTNNRQESEEENSEENGIEGWVLFGQEDVEWRDYVAKLPPLFRQAVLEVAGETKEETLPPKIAKFLALCAVLVYKGG